MYGESTRWDLVEIQELKTKTDSIKMLGEELLLRGSFSLVDLYSTNKSNL